MRQERRAILLLAALAVAGQGVRYWITRPGDAPGDVQLLAALPGHSAITHAEAATALTRPLGPDERVDIDRADVRELTRLPQVGPALARAIVADRDSNGAYGTLEALDRVPGIGPGTLRRLGPHVRFSGASSAARGLNPVPPGGVGTGLAGAVPVNRADLAQLQSLPGIGPSRARAILAWRGRHGSFSRLEDLAQVPGISLRMAARLEGLVSFALP